MAAPVSIIVPAFNQLHYCRQCIGSILTQTAEPYKLILVDNGSTDGVSEFFDCVPGATVVHARTNRGFAGGVNLGLAHAEGHVLLLNSDTIVPSGWLNRMVAAFESAPDIGIVGPMSNCVSGDQLIEGLDLQSLDAIEEVSNRLAEEKRGVLREVERLVGFCLLIRDEVVKRVGLFDEGFGIGNYEDDDYCLRTRQAGYRLAIAEDCFVFHYGGRTFAGMGITDDRWRALMAENERYIVDKWASGAPSAAAQAAALSRQAREALADGDAAEALRLFAAAVEANPLDPAHFNDLGVVLWELGEFQRAREQFRRALALDPAFEDAKTNLQRAAGEE